MNIEQITQKYGLSLLIMFGSQSRGGFRPDSDLDIAYLAEQSLPLEEEAKLATDLAEALQGEIDLADIRKSSPLLRYQVFRYGQPLYEKQRGMFAEHFTRAFRIYEETLPLYKLKLAQL